MSFDCRGARCRVPAWMTATLVMAGIYHLLFAIWVNAWPHLCFDWAGIERPNHPLLWRGVGLLSACLGVGLLIASRAPIRHWPIVLTGFLKSTLVIVLFLLAFVDGSIPPPISMLVFVDDFVWWFPFAVILWAAAQAFAGRPPSQNPVLTPAEAAEEYHLSSGETLAEAARNQTVALVFLRHFGCTFTRQILRQLEALKQQADQHGARLVLVHMLEDGRESDYLGSSNSIARIADPMCELYRSFGLGKGGFLELFGPRVWFPVAFSLIRGCGVGHLAGDGLQMPGAFLYRGDKILSAQRARTQADLPDLPGLFEELQEPLPPETVPA